MADYTNDALAGMGMAQRFDPEVQQWHEFLQIYQQAGYADASMAEVARRAGSFMESRMAGAASVFDKLRAT